MRNYASYDSFRPSHHLHQSSLNKRDRYEKMLANKLFKTQRTATDLSLYESTPTNMKGGDTSVMFSQAHHLQLYNNLIKKHRPLKLPSVVFQKSSCASQEVIR